MKHGCQWICPDATLRIPCLRSVPFVLLTIVTNAACGGATAGSPTGPTPQTITGQLAMRTITGSAWVHSTSTPQSMAGLTAEIWLERPGTTYPAGSVTSDAVGRFSFDAPADALVRLYAGTKEFFQPCLSTVRVGHTEATIRVVAKSQLLQAREWPDFAVAQVLSGTVFEATPMGRQPSVDAFVQVDGVYGDGRPLADTRTDEHGRFVVCGLEGAPRHALVVGKPEYQLAFVAIPAHEGGPLDVELHVCTAGNTRLLDGWCY